MCKSVSIQYRSTTIHTPARRINFWQETLTLVDVPRIHILYSPCGPPPWRVALCRAWFTTWHFSAPPQIVIPRSYVVDVSDTRVVSRNDVSQDGFSLQHSAKVKSVLSESLFWPRKNAYYYLKKVWNLTNIDSLRRRLNCSRVFCVVTSCVQQYTSPWKWFEKINHWNPARCRILLF
jgi:hypothetical protein